MFHRNSGKGAEAGGVLAAQMSEGGEPCGIVHVDGQAAIAEADGAGVLCGLRAANMLPACENAVLLRHGLEQALGECVERLFDVFQNPGLIDVSVASGLSGSVLQKTLG
jgi:hypothetical protein